MKTRIDILSGFLGAGKTTLILKLLESPPPGEKIAIVENEYGEVGIDGDMFKGLGLEVAEVNAGCVCCTLSGNLIAGIKLLVAQHRPGRILLEPTGLAGLGDILNILRDDGVLRVADIGTPAAVLDGSSFLRIHDSYREYFDRQLSAASAVFLNRTEGLGDGEKVDLYDRIRDVNPRLRILAEPLEAEDAWRALDEPYAPPDAPWQGLPKAWLRQFRQAAVPTGWPGSKERLAEFLADERLSGGVVRAKGHVVDGAGARFRVDLAGSTVTYELAPAGSTDFLQLIGKNLDNDALNQFFTRQL